MKRIVLAAALFLAGACGALADNNIWINVAKHPRGDDAVRAAAAVCEQRVGPDLNGEPTSPQFKRCMLRLGWRFGHTIREDTWIDPDTGLTCHNEGIASVCSNF
jgi:hypothetical protein